jgi:hypothetical protein
LILIIKANNAFSDFTLKIDINHIIDKKLINIFMLLLGFDNKMKWFLNCAIAKKLIKIH